MSRILTPRGTGDTVHADFNEIHLWDTYETRISKLEGWIAKGIGTLLVRRFNNRQWKVVVDIPGQMIVIACDSISNTKGFHIHMKGRTIHGLQERAVFAAGEILERHNLSRNKKFDADIFETLPRDSKDDVIAPDSTPESI